MAYIPDKILTMFHWRALLQWGFRYIQAAVKYQFRLIIVRHTGVHCVHYCFVWGEFCIIFFCNSGFGEFYGTPTKYKAYGFEDTLESAKYKNTSCMKHSFQYKCKLLIWLWTLGPFQWLFTTCEYHLALSPLWATSWGLQWPYSICRNHVWRLGNFVTYFSACSKFSILFFYLSPSYTKYSVSFQKTVIFWERNVIQTKPKTHGNKRLI